jgi:hypothetical protein
MSLLRTVRAPLSVIVLAGWRARQGPHMTDVRAFHIMLEVAQTLDHLAEIEAGSQTPPSKTRKRDAFAWRNIASARVSPLPLRRFVDHTVLGGPPCRVWRSIPVSFSASSPTSANR